MGKTLVTKHGGKNSTIPNWRFLLTCLLGFAGFLRDSHLKILIPKSKRDQHREGRVVYISRIKSECCPVKFLEAYL